MKTIPSAIERESDRDLYWTKIIFLSDDKTKKSSVFACISEEKLTDSFRLAGEKKLEQKYLDEWVASVVNKWSALGERILDQDVHYDVYSNTSEGEANGLDFLITKVQAS